MLLKFNNLTHISINSVYQCSSFYTWTVLFRLQTLATEIEQAPHRLTTLTTAGERLYPDTAAAGRETIRQQLRDIRDR